MIEETFAFLCIASLVVGCGSADPETEAPSVEVAACTDYCDAAEAVACPRRGDCMSNCVALFDLGCRATLADLLACAAPLMTDACVPQSASGMLACESALASYVSCVPVDVGVPFSSCGPSQAVSPHIELGCEGVLVCDNLELRVECDAEGACTCLRNGALVGTCDNILSSGYLCAPHASCCTPFFAPG